MKEYCTYDAFIKHGSTFCCSETIFDDMFGNLGHILNRFLDLNCFLNLKYMSYGYLILCIGLLG